MAMFNWSLDRLHISCLSLFCRSPCIFEVRNEGNLRKRMERKSADSLDSLIYQQRSPPELLYIKHLQLTAYIFIVYYNGNFHMAMSEVVHTQRNGEIVYFAKDEISQKKSCKFLSGFDMKTLLSTFSYQHFQFDFLAVYVVYSTIVSWQLESRALTWSFRSKM